MQTMKLTGLRQMEQWDVPRPAVSGPTDVLVKMARVGICGSDVHYYAEGGIGSQRVQHPWTVGHEGAGIITEIGNAVTRARVGDRVAFDPAHSCGQCDQCHAGRPHTCRRQTFLGCPGQTEGCLAEYMVLPEQSVYRLPDGMTLEEGALIEPLSIGMYALRLAHLPPGARIGILGAGPIGLSVLLPAKAQSKGRIYVTDKINARLHKAAQLGAEWTGNVDTGDVVHSILSRESLGLDAVFECSGSQDAMNDGVELLRPGGTLLLIGIPGAQSRVSFDINLLRRKELTVQNVRRQNGCVQPAIDAVARKDFDAAAMITHRLPFAETPPGFHMVEHYADGVVKAMIAFPD